MTIRGQALGTAYSIKLIGPEGALDEAALVKAVKEELDRVDRLMSTYREDSELMRLNRAATGVSFPISPETLNVLQTSAVAERLTRGGFDPTVGPLVRLWKFGPGRESGFSIPSDEAIEAARASVGFSAFVVQEDPPAVIKTVDGLELDLSAVAKGFVVDQIARRLRREGVSRMMVEVGGEVRAAGLAGNDRLWKIGIEKPVVDARRVQRIVPLMDMSLATSGDYRNFHEVDGKRYSHTIDPATGRPARHNLASVTVLHEACAMADALATGLLVAGPENALAIANEHDLAVLLIEREGEEFTETESPAWQQYHRDVSRDKR